MGSEAYADVVYIIGPDSEELRYSLRSLVNFPHGKVWIFGRCPEWASPDRVVPFEQTGASKWERSTSTFRKICGTEEVSEDFWLFNDDFFIMEPVAVPYMYHGTIAEKVKGQRSGYADQLRECERQLLEKGCTTLNYALHVPMLINKAKALEVLDTFTSPMFRSLYGNYCKVGGIEAEDVKNRVGPLMSTSDLEFRHGRCGRIVRERFTEMSKWEGGKSC